MEPERPRAGGSPPGSCVRSCSTVRFPSLLLVGAILGLSLALMLGVDYLLFRTRIGYALRAVAERQEIAQLLGVNVRATIVFAFMLSGALAGLGGMSEVAGVVRRLQTSPIAAGYGFTGIIVAWLAKLNPLVIILVSVLFGALILAGREIQPSGVPKMIQGIILVCLIASDFLLRYRIRIVKGEEE